MACAVQHEIGNQKPLVFVEEKFMSGIFVINVLVIRVMLLNQMLKMAK